MRMLLDRYGMVDQTHGKAPGESVSPGRQSTCTDLVSSATTRTEAMKVRMAVEEAAIASLTEDAHGGSPPLTSPWSTPT